MSRSQASAAGRRPRWALVMALYLFGIFMGAIDTGIVTPGRTVIQRDLHVADQVGIWMITIYTLAYAAAIPIMGKLADRVGRKRIYLISITLFGLGSLACGLSQDVGSFGMLIGARALQAVGGGGILPIATAEIGTEVPEERRGMALGLVGAVYGIANIFGASAGSLILDVVGVHNWQWIFYVNVPIAVAIVGVGLAILPNHRETEVRPIDVLGSLLLVAMILSLLYGIRNLDFFDFAASIRSTDVWPFLAAFVALAPLFVLAERRAADPVLNLRYFTDFGHGGVLLLSLLSGVALMAVVFVPQFAENALRIHSGAGGYTVIALGLASGIGAPMSGTLTDKFGPKRVLAFGALLSLGGAAAALFWAIPQPGTASVFTALGLFGLGLGFVIGSPLNYMMLARTPKRESNSALGTLSLVRSIGTTLAPAIMVGFLAQAGAGMQDRLMGQLPTTVAVPALPYASELQAKFVAMKADDTMKDQLAGVEFPDLDAQKSIEVDPTGGGALSDDLVDLLKTADVTTIVERSKTVARAMFARETPARVAEIQAGVAKGISGLDAGTAKLDAAVVDMTSGLATMDGKLAEMATGIDDMTTQLDTLDGKIDELDRGIAGMDSAIAGIKKGIPGVQAAIAGMDDGLARQTAAIGQLSAQRDAAASKLADLQAQLKTVTAQRAQLLTARDGAATGRAKLDEARDGLRTGRVELVKARADLAAGRDKAVAAQADLAETRRQLTVLSDAVPGAFDTALATYLAEIDARGPQLETTYQSTLGEGFRGVFAVYGAACLLMLLILPLIPRGRPEDASAPEPVGLDPEPVGAAS